MNAPQIKTKEYVAYPPPKFHTTIDDQPTQVPAIFNKKEWSKTKSFKK